MQFVDSSHITTGIGDVHLTEVVDGPLEAGMTVMNILGCLDSPTGGSCTSPQFFLN